LIFHDSVNLKNDLSFGRDVGHPYLPRYRQTRARNFVRLDVAFSRKQPELDARDPMLETEIARPGWLRVGEIPLLTCLKLYN
jgi:hypothetical protein